MAQICRAILFASATAATILGFQATRLANSYSPEVFSCGCTVRS
jgi:hypothetical protein